MLLFLFFSIIGLIGIYFVAKNLNIRLIVKDYQYISGKKKSVKPKVKLALYVYNIKILSINLLKHGNKLQNANKEILKHIKLNKSNNKYSIKNINDILKNIEIFKLNLNLIIGTPDIITTSISVGIISFVISQILMNNTWKYNTKAYYYNIQPEYNQTQTPFYINLNIDIVLKLQVVHIFNMLKTIIKQKGEQNKYERASNRRINAYCNGKH